MVGPAARKRRGGVNELEIVESASDLRPRMTYNNGNNTTTQPLERVVRLPAGGPARRAALTHHAATPFDLNTHLWLLQHGEPDRWYTRPSSAQLRRFRQLAALDAGDDAATLLNATCTANARPAPADVVRIAAGPVMGAAAAAADDDDDIDAFLTFYMVIEAPRAASPPADDRLDHFAPYPPAPPLAPAGCRGEDRVYRVERAGSAAACAAAAYHNAALRGWSTVFCCAVAGEAEWAGEGCVRHQ
ncbi:chloride chloride channel family [Neofusicoccum parvum]|nr:chloride chloride channel family [Neofusicoccum parvum]